MVDSHNIDHVLAVVSQSVDIALLRVVVEELVPGIESYAAVRVTDGSELIISKVARMLAELLAVGMRSDERTSVHDARDVPETCLVEVGCIDDHLLIDHA